MWEAIVIEALLEKKQQYASGLKCLLLKNKSESVQLCRQGTRRLFWGHAIRSTTWALKKGVIFSCVEPHQKKIPLCDIAICLISSGKILKGTRFIVPLTCYVYIYIYLDTSRCRRCNIYISIYIIHQLWEAFGRLKKKHTERQRDQEHSPPSRHGHLGIRRSCWDWSNFIPKE